MPSIGHDNHRSGQPEHSGHGQIPDDEERIRNPFRHEEEEHPAGEGGVHQHGHEQALGMVVDPDHENPKSGQHCHVEQDLGQEQGNHKRPSVIAAAPEGHKKMPRAPHDSHDEAGGKHAVTLSQLRRGEPGPTNLLEDACGQSRYESEQNQGRLVVSGEDAGEEFG